MSVEDIKKRFVEEIKLRAYDDKYIDKNEEREIWDGFRYGPDATIDG